MITCYVVFSENAANGKVYDLGYKDDEYKGMVEFLLTKQDEIKKHIDEKLSKKQENEA